MSLEPEPEGFADNIGGNRAANKSGGNIKGRLL